MMKNEIYNLKDVPQFVAVIMNIENQSFLYKSSQIICYIDFFCLLH